MECKHQFWKDRNPDTCLFCGKTEEEIYKEKIIKAERERIIKKIDEHRVYGGGEIIKIIDQPNR